MVFIRSSAVTRVARRQVVIDSLDTTMQEQQDTPVSNANRIANAAKLVGESVFPGALLMMDGKLANGAVHALPGFGARAWPARPALR